MGTTIAGSCILAVGVAVWTWATTRVLNANVGHRVPYFHGPAHQPDYRRTISAFASATTFLGMLLVGESGPRSGWLIRAVIVCVVVFVLVPAATLTMTAMHNRRNPSPSRCPQHFA